MPEENPGQNFPKEVILVNDNLSIEMQAANAKERPVTPLTEDDRTLRAHSLQVLRRTSGGNEEVVALADPAGIIRTRAFEPYTHVTAESLAATEDSLYVVPASSVARFWVEFVNNSGAAAAVTAYRIESGGSAGVGNMILQAVPVTANGVGIKLGPYVLEAAGVLSAFSSVADAITAHVTVEEYGTGDAVAVA